jgi:DNA polymerase-1
MGYEVVRNWERLGHIANEIERTDVVALDLETVGFNPHDGRTRLCSLNTGFGVYVIDLFETQNLGPVAQALTTSKAVKVGQNLKFDQRFLLKEFGVELYPVFDTFRASYMLHNGKDDMGHNLYDLYGRELGIGPEAPDLGGSDWSGTLTKEQLDYSAEDVIHLPDLRKSLRQKILDAGLGRACTIEFGAILPEASIEVNGFPLDRDMWMALADANRAEAATRRDELLAKLPSPSNQMALPGMNAYWNLDSNDQLLKSLNKLGIQIQDTQKTTLAMAAAKHPLVKLVMEYRKVAKRLSSFGPDYLKHLHPKTGRIHCDYWPLTGAGRYACSNPNLQQIPRDKKFRSCFRPRPGWKFVIADYSQIELRLVADVSGDKMLRDIYLKGEDAHQRTASIISACSMDAVTKDQRQMAKPVNFGLMYGMGWEKLILYAMTNYGVALSPNQAKQFHSRYFEAYSGVQAWHSRVIRDGKRTGISHTKAGRLRYLDPQKAFNEFYNTPIQGTGADGLKASMPLVYKRIKQYEGRVRMVHMVHDEICLEVQDDPDLLLAAKHDLESSMVEGMQPLIKSVPVLVEGGVGESWAEK